MRFLVPRVKMRDFGMTLAGTNLENQKLSTAKFAKKTAKHAKKKSKLEHHSLLHR
jgi:hypothetical protein